ncbi:hypothetical protein U1Q18_035437, partial [Sarracenia purpurea var. burkii]
MIVDGGSKIGDGGVKIVHVRDGGFEEVTGLPQPGALVHVLIEPFISDGEVELVNENGELGVEGAEGGKEAVVEVDGHGVVGGEGTVEIIQASR